MVALIWLLACGVNEDKFDVSYLDSYCAWAARCGYAESEDACHETYADAEDHTGCDYDKHAAKDCLKGMEDLQCPADGAGPSFPDACYSVYTGCSGGDSDSP